VPGKTLVQIKNYFQNYKAKLGLDRLALPAGAVAPRRRRSREPEHSSGAFAWQPWRSFCMVFGGLDPRLAPTLLCTDGSAHACWVGFVWFV